STFSVGPFKDGSNNAAVLSGVTDPGQFTNPDPANRDINLKLFQISNLRTSAADPSKVDVLFFHASSDLRQIDILTEGNLPPLVDNLDYGEQTVSYISLDPANYRLDFTPSGDNSTILTSYQADFSNMQGRAIMLFAGGFLVPEQNQNGSSLKLLKGDINSAGGQMPETQLDYSSIPVISYASHVQPLFNSFCVSCHGASLQEGGLRLDSWAELIKGSSYGEAVIPFDAENSLMIEMMTQLVNGPHPADQGEDTVRNNEIEFLERWIDEGAKNDAEETPYEHSTNRLYVCDQAPGETMVSIIDSKALVVIRSVKLMDLGFQTDAKPHHIAVEPDGSAWYLSLIGQNQIVKFNSDNELVAQSGQYALPALLGLHPGNGQLYVSRFMDPANPLDAIVVLNSSDLSPAAGTNQGEVPVQFKIPHAMAVDHAGVFAYTASLSENQLIVINTSTNEVEMFVPLGADKGPLQMTISPDDQEIYLSAQIANEMLVIETANHTVVDAIAVGSQPWHPAFTPDGSKVYVGNQGSNSVSVIDTGTRTVIKTIQGNGLSNPHGIAVSGDGQYVFVSNQNKSGDYVPRHNFGDNGNVGTVVVIDTNTDEIVKVLEVENFGSGMAIWEGE
ncbi:MAG: c-type cytochrome domain-containing protein, partial [Calditrichia bacterium]